MARKRCVLRWGAAVGLYWAACAAHVWRTGGLLALGLAWNMLLALLRRVWASMDTFQLQVTLLFAGAVFLLWLAYGALRPVDGEKQENKESDALST